MQPTKFLTTKELAEKTAGGDSYIRTKNNEVVALAVTKNKNPKAPRIITVGKGPRVIKNAELLENTKSAIPVYLKFGVNQWLYKGDYRVIRFSQDKNDIKEYHGKRPVEEIYGIFFLEKVN